MNTQSCYFEPNRARIRKNDEKMPNRDRYQETTKDFDYSDWCIVTLKDSKKVFTRQIWHVFISWVGINNSDIIDWDYASRKEIYENRKADLSQKIQQLMQNLNDAQSEMTELENWYNTNKN